MTSGTEVGAAGEPTRATGPARTRTQPEAIVDTAEIEKVAPSRPRRISSPYERQFEEPEHRAPAPMGLQILVWLLFVVFVVGIVGLAVEHFHPSWISFMRNTIGTHSPSSHNHSVGSNSSSTSLAQTNSTGLTKQSSNAKGATYVVPTTASYTIVVTVANRCFVGVTSPPSSKHYVFASTIDASQSPEAIQVAGSSSLLLGAQATSIAVKVSGKQVGEISPPQLGYTYTFNPSGH
ncbi:MAG: hypothetical protein WB770_07035 [Acidimicrobiales bacterium]